MTCGSTMSPTRSACSMCLTSRGCWTATTPLVPAGHAWTWHHTNCARDSLPSVMAAKGLDLFFEASEAAAVHERLAVGWRVRLLNDDALESLRILLGVPRWGAELDENTMPAEAGLEERAVSYTKGCYHRAGGGFAGQKRWPRQSAVCADCVRWTASPSVRRNDVYGPSTPYAGRQEHVGKITSAAPSAGPRRGGFHRVWATCGAGGKRSRHAA